jgi:hypothetical protein
MTNLCQLQTVTSPLSFVQSWSAWSLFKGLILRNQPQDSQQLKCFVTSLSTSKQLLAKGSVFGSEVLGFIKFTLFVNNPIDIDIILKIYIYLRDKNSSFLMKPKLWT